MSPRTLTVALLGAHVLWSLFYIARTSFLIGNVRVFSLWDDAMISMTYARNLAEGYGLVWNAGGERIQGYSNLGVTLVMALVHLLPVGPLRTAAVFQLLQVALLVWTFVALSDLPRSFFAADRWSAPATVAVAALFAPLSVWALQGSDVGCITAALVTAAWLAGRSYERRGTMGLGPFVVLAAAIVMRIDASLFYAVFLAVLAREKASKGRVAAALVLFVATWAALLAFGWWYYGDLLPNTYYLKATGAPRSLVLERGLSELWGLLGVLSPPLLAGLAVWIATTAARAPLALLWAPAALGVAYNVWVGGDWRPDYLSRFVVPGITLLVPLLVAAARWIGDALADRARLAPPWRRALPAVMVAGMAFQLNPPVAAADWLWPRTETLLRSWNLENTRHGLYFGAFTAPGTTLALHWAGIPAYFARRPCIDVLGRSDRHIARLVVRIHEPGHSKWDWDYVLALHPDIFQHESRGLLDRPDFRRDYMRARTPEGLEFFLRRDSVTRVRDSEIRLSELSAP